MELSMTTLETTVTAVPLPRDQRSLAPDIARGAMLLFIALANVPLFLWGRAMDSSGHIADSTGLDHALLFIEQLLIAERSRPMFAILYGFGIAIMASRMAARGFAPKGIRKVLRRRSAWLIALGVLHATLLFFGDILAAYGATGLIALGLVHLPDRSLKRWFWASFAFVATVTTALLAVIQSGAIEDFAETGETYVAGSNYLEAIGFGLFASSAQMFLSLVLLAFLPMVIGGMMLQRAGWLTAPGNHLVGLRRVFVTGMVVNVVSSLPVALASFGAWEPTAFGGFAAAYATTLGGMYAGLGYICGFALLAHKFAHRGRTGVLAMVAALGERSLSGYLGQSFIMVPLLAPWGFNLAYGLGYAGAFGIALGAWTVTVLVAVALDRAGKRGPFETLMRRLTYGRPAADFNRLDAELGPVATRQRG
jgi:uncharacterized membrane protein YeiB